MSMIQTQHWYIWSYFMQSAKATRYAYITLLMSGVWHDCSYVKAGRRWTDKLDCGRFMLRRSWRLINLTDSCLCQTRLQLGKCCHLVLQKPHVCFVSFHLQTDTTLYPSDTMAMASVSKIIYIQHLKTKVTMPWSLNWTNETSSNNQIDSKTTTIFTHIFSDVLTAAATCSNCPPLSTRCHCHWKLWVNIVVVFRLNWSFNVSSQIMSLFKNRASNKMA